jgi:hypothetical protein
MTTASAGVGVAMRKRRPILDSLRVVGRGALDHVSAGVWRTTFVVLQPPARPERPDMDDLLRVTASPIDRHRVIVEVAGGVDHYTAPLFRSCLDRQCDRRGLGEVVVDLEGVTSLSGAGTGRAADAHLPPRPLLCGARRRLPQGWVGARSGRSVGRSASSR